MPGDEESVGTFQRTVIAETPFTAVADIITQVDGHNAICVDSTQMGVVKAEPLSFAQLRKFIAEFSLARFGIGRDDVVCTSIRNGPEAALCFWAITGQCTFAPLNPNLTAPEVDFELTDLPCHTMLLLKLQKDELGFVYGSPNSIVWAAPVPLPTS